MRHHPAARMTGAVHAIAIVAVATSALAGCSSGSSSSSSSDTLTVGLSAEVECVDPHQTPATPPLHVARQVVDNLTDQDPESGEIVPWLATSWTVNDDATEFTFKLRDGASFSDGAPVDAAAVVANLEDVVALGAKSPIGSGYLKDFTAAEAVDASTVRVTFAEPSAQFLQATSMVTLGLLSPDNLALDSRRRCAGELVGSGPFVLDEVSANREITLDRRDDYDWASSLAAHDGPARTSRVVFSVVPDAGARHGSLESGQIDVDTQVLQQDEPGFGGDTQLLSGTRPGIVYTLLPNESRATLQDPEVRLAIGEGIDRTAFAPLLSKGEAPATNVLASTTPGWTDLSNRLEHDPRAAEARLEAAGWTAGSDGIRRKDGKPLTLSLVYAASERYGTIYQLMAQQLTEIGVDLQLQPLDDATNSARQSAGDYDFVSWAVTRADPTILSSVFPVESANPLKRTTPDDVDALIGETSSVVDGPSRVKAVDAAVDAILTPAHGIPLFEQASSVGLGRGVDGVRLDASSRPILHDAEVTR